MVSASAQYVSGGMRPSWQRARRSSAAPAARRTAPTSAAPHVPRRSVSSWSSAATCRRARISKVSTV